ncbi:MAG: HigA family addiction module antitoxin [Geovibrio sp.]|nr:HigA family addiction module antitoxin [Geovibrio sp.]MCD8567514.1 HigA family addiction module antitoxin [Geovibrio sp.]
MAIQRDMYRKAERQPEHPGEYLSEIIEEMHGLTQSSLAVSLGVSFRTINQICNKRRGISPEIALKLSKFFGTTPQSWLNMQQAYDLWKAEQTTDLSRVQTLSA